MQVQYEAMWSDIYRLYEYKSSWKGANLHSAAETEAKAYMFELNILTHLNENFCLY